MEKEKINLWYCILKNKSVDVVVQNSNFNISSYKKLLKYYPKKYYNYIKITNEE
jgi:hypothetical protein